MGYLNDVKAKRRIEGLENALKNRDVALNRSLLRLEEQGKLLTRSMHLLDNETKRAETAEAAHLSMVGKYTDLLERFGELEQSRSDTTFHMKKLFGRSVVALGLDPSSTSWFDIVDKIEAAAKLAAQISELEK